MWLKQCWWVRFTNCREPLGHWSREKYPGTARLIGSHSAIPIDKGGYTRTTLRLKQIILFRRGSRTDGLNGGESIGTLVRDQLAPVFQVACMFTALVTCHIQTVSWWWEMPGCYMKLLPRTRQIVDKWTGQLGIRKLSSQAFVSFLPGVRGKKEDSGNRNAVEVALICILNPLNRERWTYFWGAM